MGPLIDMQPLALIFGMTPLTTPPPLGSSEHSSVEADARVAHDTKPPFIRNESTGLLPERQPASGTGSCVVEFLYEEMADACLSRLRQFIPSLPAITRLRLFAFIQLLEAPEALGATLSCEAPGGLRLTLMTTQDGREAPLPE
ncbi:hypothetical protein DES45_104272 [Microvirga subterranea]|uniref:Uncharacterized protein n=1 Tax=Microvirga subterranea TaxID=186651 RepID=A0A370HLZ7_9HYPH|nr:hypothetical protein DES45_104272 [Microvirga subterranea]